MEINIGDKVRFLNSVGGGIVTGFKKGGLVLVEDEDGFEVPVLQSEVVGVASEGRTISDFMAKPEAKPVGQKNIPSEEYSDEEKSGEEYQQISPAVLKKMGMLTSSEKKKQEEESLETRVLRLELTIRKLQNRIESLEKAWRSFTISSSTLSRLKFKTSVCFTFQFKPRALWKQTNSTLLKTSKRCLCDSAQNLSVTDIVCFRLLLKAQAS